MVTYKLHLIRHGMTMGNLEGRYVGRMDIPVCADGVRELKALMEKHDYPMVQEVYTSPLIRCRQTADILFPDTSITVVEDLVEMSLGDFEGKSFASLKEDPRYIAWLQNSMQNTPPGALETSEEFTYRVGVALNAILMNMSANHITEAAVVTHGGVLMSMMSRFALPRRPMGEWAVANGCGYTIRTSTQMWMRDETFEIIGTVPEGVVPGNDERTKRALGTK